MKIGVRIIQDQIIRDWNDNVENKHFIDHYICDLTCLISGVWNVKNTTIDKQTNKNKIKQKNKQKLHKQ
jgi:hypothetical protein